MKPIKIQYEKQRHIKFLIQTIKLNESESGWCGVEKRIVLSVAACLSNDIKSVKKSTFLHRRVLWLKWRRRKNCGTVLTCQHFYVSVFPLSPLTQYPWKLFFISLYVVSLFTMQSNIEICWTLKNPGETRCQQMIWNSTFNNNFWHFSLSFFISKQINSVFFSEKTWIFYRSLFFCVCDDDC